MRYIVAWKWKSGGQEFRLFAAEYEAFAFMDTLDEDVNICPTEIYKGKLDVY